MSPGSGVTNGLCTSTVLIASRTRRPFILPDNGDDGRAQSRWCRPFMGPPRALALCCGFALNVCCAGQCEKKSGSPIFEGSESRQTVIRAPGTVSTCVVSGRFPPNFGMVMADFFLL
jgi:hypothetical protein